MEAASSRVTQAGQMPDPMAMAQMTGWGLLAKLFELMLQSVLISLRHGNAAKQLCCGANPGPQPGPDVR